MVLARRCKSFVECPSPLLNAAVDGQGSCMVKGLVGQAHRPGQEKKKEVEEKARLATCL